MLLGYPNGECIEDVSEAQILEVFEALDLKNPRFSLQRDPDNAIRIVRHFHSRYFIVLKQKRKVPVQSKHLLPEQRARETLLAFIRGEQDWAEKIRWEEVTPDNTQDVGPEIPIEYTAPLKQAATS